MTSTAVGSAVVLRLEVLDYAGPTRWRWRLSDADGRSLAEHDVELDEHEWQTGAFADLRNYLRDNADPDRRLAHEAELVVGVGAWCSERVLGQVALELAKACGPVRIDVPPEATELAYRPWELAMVDERPLLAHGVSFVAAADQPLADKAPVTHRVRMLAVFSAPDGTDDLHPRNERFALTRQVHRIASTHQKGIELRVLQYGITKERLRQVLRDTEGWDVVHVSGPDLAAGLVLTDDAGRPDVVSGKELVDLLEPAAGRIKLVTLTPAESAATMAAEVARSLGLPAARPVEQATDAESLPSIAHELARRLDCAVMTMRYPVSDEFAVQLAEPFYDIVLGSGRSVAEALPLAVTLVAGGAATPAVPALSAGTPMVLGARATEPIVAPPGHPIVFQVERQRLAEFPPQPQRFVGRAGLLARATAVLADTSGRTGVVLHGRPGIGATSCALELAYTHQDAFATFAWYSAQRDADPATALVECTLAVQRQIPGLRLAHLVHDPETWRAALPDLTSGLARLRVLVVLDNIDGLLTDDGEWRDERWAQFAQALTEHDGPARVVMTSHRLPAGLPVTVAVEQVPAMSLAETSLLARAWKPLRELIEATDEQSHTLAAEVLAQSQGHPMLVELAQGDKGDVLRARLAAADQTWGEHGLSVRPFLSDAEPATDHSAVLSGWLADIVSALPVQSVPLFDFLCCMAPDDRITPVIESAWPAIWRSGHQSAVPPAEHAATALVDHELVTVDVESESRRVTAYWIHPVIAEWGRRRVSAEFDQAVADVVANCWLATLQDAHERDLNELVSRSVVAVAPYLRRLGRWEHLAKAATRALSRDDSVETAAALLPVLTDPALRRVHLKALSIVDPGSAEPELKRLLDAAVDDATATSVANDLYTMYRATGRWEDAVAMVEMTEQDTRAGLGQWARLGTEADRLHVMYQQGHFAETLAAVTDHRATMATLPDTDDVVEPWTVREAILGVGVIAAYDLGRWTEALELNAAIQQSQEDRKAAESERAVTWFNDYSPLIRVGQAQEAREQLYRCRAVFGRTEDITMMGNTLSALADADSHLGHLDQSCQQETDALRLKYQGTDPEAIAVSHYNLANYLVRAGQDMLAVWGHRLAAAVIRYQIGSPRLTTSLESIGRLLGEDPTAEPKSPLSFDDVCAVVVSMPGIRFSELFTALPGRTDDGQQAIDDIMRLTVEVRDSAIQESTDAWEPVISALVVAAQPDPPAELAPLLEAAFTELWRSHVWRELVVVLRRISAGPDHHSWHTADNLDPASAIIAHRARAAVAGEIEVDQQAWRVLLED
jgi:hypothetical protein